MDEEQYAQYVVETGGEKEQSDFDGLHVEQEG